MKKLALIATICIMLALPMVISSLVSASPATLTIRPDAAGSNTTWTPSAGANWECVDEVTPNETDYVSATTDGSRDSYTLTNHTAETETITNVRVYVRAITTGTAKTIRIAVVIGGTPYEAAADQTVAKDTYTNYYDDWAQNPATNALWTWTDIDNLEASFSAPNVQPKQTNVTTVWVEVTYAPTLESYEDADYNTVCDNFTAAKNQVWMKATELSPGNSYMTAFYDASTSGNGTLQATDIDTANTTGILTGATYILTDNLSAVGDGNWHAVVFYPSDTEAPGTYDPASANVSKVVEDAFYVHQGAIPEFPTILAAIGVSGLCFGIYYWMRRRRYSQIVDSQ